MSGKKVVAELLIAVIGAVAGGLLLALAVDIELLNALASLFFAVSIITTIWIVWSRSRLPWPGRTAAAIGAFLFLSLFFSWSRIRSVHLPFFVVRNPDLARLIEPPDKALLTRPFNELTKDGPFEVGELTGRDFELHVIVPYSWRKGEGFFTSRTYACRAYFVVSTEATSTGLRAKNKSLVKLSVRPSMFLASHFIGWFDTVVAWNNANRIGEIVQDRINGITSTP